MSSNRSTQYGSVVSCSSCPLDPFYLHAYVYPYYDLLKHIHTSISNGIPDDIATSHFWPTEVGKELQSTIVHSAVQGILNTSFVVLTTKVLESQHWSLNMLFSFIVVFLYSNCNFITVLNKTTYCTCISTEQYFLSMI